MKQDQKRRAFLKEVSLGSAAVFMAPLLSAAPVNASAHAATSEFALKSEDAAAENIILNNGVEIELLTDKDKFIGIGKVSANKTPLRNGTIPMFCEIRTPDGVRVTEYQLSDKKISADGIFLKFSVIVHREGLMDYSVHTVRNRENLYGWVTEPAADDHTIVSLEIVPVTQKIGKYHAIGFTYQYKFKSDNLNIYKILDHSTWEVDGSAIGNECRMRLGHAPSIFAFTNTEQRYSTECYIKGIANPNVFQFLPLQTEMQGFTFTAHSKGVLVTHATQPSHVRTIIEKPHNDDRIFHFHQHCNDLSKEFTTSPMEILWIDERNTTPAERYNVYEAVRSMVAENLNRQAGIKEEHIVTYGEIEEWDEPDFDKYTNYILPRFIKRGVKKVFIPNLFENTMNTWGVSNMCCNVDYKFSPNVGADKVQAFCKAANDAGITVEMWGNTAISTLTEMFMWRDGKEKGIKFLPLKDSIAEVLQTAEEPFVRNISNAIEADHYTPRFAVLNMRDKSIMDYWMKCWKVAKDTGISGIFLDSSFNMTSDKFHFIQNVDKNKPLPPIEGQHWAERPLNQPGSAILTQFPAHLELIKKMQDMGYSYCGEDLGVFGLHRHGPDMVNILDWLPMWKDCVMIFDETQVPASMNALDIFFRGIAYRISWCMQWDFKKNAESLGISNSKAYDYIEAFNKVNHLMRHREILPDEMAVKYLSADGKTTVYWAFKTLTIQLSEKSKIWNVTDNKSISSKTLNMSPFNVYVVS
jgi:hypothetical protein